jgi:hypothetical protein
MLSVDQSEYKIYHYDKDCELRCGDHNSCIRLKYRAHNYSKCQQCKENDKNFYHDIVNYNCNSDEDKYKKEVLCNFDVGMGCPNYNNISSQKMIEPYYIIKKSSTNKLSNAEVCEFCWNFN